MGLLQIALSNTLQWEGGYVNDPQDNGETYRGISRHFWGDWQGWGIIDRYNAYKKQPAVLDKKLLKRDDLQNLIKDFYCTNFWIPIKGDLITSQCIANKLFDLAVNMGYKPAIKCLQKAIEVCCCNINVDGIMGDLTLNAINTCNDVDNLLDEFKAEAEEYYKSLNKPKYLKGWLKRLYS